MKIPIKQNLNALPLPATDKWPEGVWDIEAFTHGSMSLLLFAPKGTDYQTPHDQDELYIVVEGDGVLEVENEEFPFSIGDTLFVPALKEHRFIRFSREIKMWVVLWGKRGGEVQA